MSLTLSLPGEDTKGMCGFKAAECAAGSEHAALKGVPYALAMHVAA